MRRREAAGLTHVLRTKGSLFVDPQTGLPLTGIPVSSTPSVPDTGAPKPKSGVPGTDKTGIPEPATPIRNKNLPKEALRQEPRPSSSFLSERTAQLGVLLDDDAVRQLQHRCRLADAEATNSEIAHFAEVKINQLRRSGRVDNWVGLLISSVPEYFKQPATELMRYRKAHAAATAFNAERSEHTLAEARALLADPNADDADKRLARELLGEMQGAGK